MSKGQQNTRAKVSYVLLQVGELLSVLGVVHFSLSMLCWALMLWSKTNDAPAYTGFLQRWRWDMTVSVFFLVGFALVFFMFRKRSRWASYLLILSIVVSACVCYGDLKGERCQYYIAWHGENGGGESIVYCTWWWNTTLGSTSAR